MFERPHHRRIAEALSALDGPLLRDHGCLFGGGTAIALRFGEYRESVAIDFLVSDLAGYRHLRQRVAEEGIAALVRPGAVPPAQLREVRADQYGIRTQIGVADLSIKFEIVLEARFALEAPGPVDVVCGVASLTPLDLATSKLLANADRWRDDSVFSRDLIDLAMLQPALPLLRQAIGKAETAYGDAVRRSLEAAIERLRRAPDRLERCMTALSVTLPRALVWDRIHALGRVLRPPRGTGAA